MLHETVLAGSLVSFSAKGDKGEMKRFCVSKRSGKGSAWSKLGSKFVYSFLTHSTGI